jgi:ubiquinone/menaquinone biosynthesis C-methylase UbiE
MSDTYSQYSRTVEYYRRYRPRYPQTLVEWLKNEFALSLEHIIADIGSGTGQMTELFLRNRNLVYSIEPNADMRRAAEQELRAYSNLKSLDATAEATTLPDSSVNLITVGNAFHWFNHSQTRKEFFRILKPQGWVILAWNLERNNGSPFAMAFEGFWQKHIDPAARFKRASERKRSDSVTQFFGADYVKEISFDNYQVCDYEALKGVILSFLRAPQPEDQRYPVMVDELKALFSQHQENGVVTLDYDTAVSYGQLLP